jgi:uncharacterized membrane protein
VSEDFEAATEGLGDGRRSFLKKMAIGTAFTVPVVSSFTMAGIQAVYAQTPTASGNVSANTASNSTTTSSSTTTSTSTSTTSTTTTTQPNTED